MIDTYVHEMKVEIEGVEYPVAAKTIEVAEKLAEVAKRMAGQPEYKLWLAELEVILGKEAVRNLFKSGRKENIDRMYRIYSGVLDAFEYNAEQVNSEKLERKQSEIASVTDGMKQLMALLKIGEERSDVIRRA